MRRASAFALLALWNLTLERVCDHDTPKCRLHDCIFFRNGMNFRQINTNLRRIRQTHVLRIKYKKTVNIENLRAMYLSRDSSARFARVEYIEIAALARKSPGILGLREISFNIYQP